MASFSFLILFHCNEMYEYKVSIPFDRKNLLPPEITNTDCCNNYMVFIIHFKNRVYGYLAATIEENDWFDVFTQGSIMNLANAFENAAMQKKLADLEDIRNLYMRDSLTGLYNRRGFDKQLRDQMDHVDKNSNAKCYAVSIDMDGLKYINDTFGHMEGDKALMYLAEALKKTMRNNEFCARNGGDEFTAFLCGEDGAREEEFVKEFYDALDEVNKLGLPYEIQASVGICALGEHESDTLISCIQKADMRMYENKKQRKQKQKNA
ncbi:MAG: GGDEF domain-containing protein [Lachnospiraceae bacterium]|nr:GGDEF domain-containing protein [Lachnospiraceae bacterium]